MLGLRGCGIFHFLKKWNDTLAPPRPTTGLGPRSGEDPLIPSSLVAWGGAEVAAVPAALSVTGVSFLLVVGCLGIAQFADGAEGQIRQEEVAGAVHPEVLAHERAEPGHVLVSDWVPLGLELADGGVKVDSPPQNNAIQNKSEDAELF